MKRSWRIISFILTLIILLVSVDLSPFKMIVNAEDEVINIDNPDYNSDDSTFDQYNIWTEIGEAYGIMYKSPNFDTGVFATINGEPYAELQDVIDFGLNPDKEALVSYELHSEDYCTLLLLKYLIGSVLEESQYNAIKGMYPNILSECAKSSNRYLLDKENFLELYNTSGYNNETGTCTTISAYLNVNTGKFTYVIIGLDTELEFDWGDKDYINDDMNIRVKVISSPYLLISEAFTSENATDSIFNNLKNVQKYYRNLYDWSSYKLRDYLFNLDKSKLSNLQLDNVLKFGITDDSKFYLTIQAYPVLSTTECFDKAIINPFLEYKYADNVRPSYIDVYYDPDEVPFNSETDYEDNDYLATQINTGWYQFSNTDIDFGSLDDIKFADGTGRNPFGDFTLKLVNSFVTNALKDLENNPSGDLLAYEPNYKTEAFNDILDLYQDLLKEAFERYIDTLNYEAEMGKYASINPIEVIDEFEILHHYLQLRSIYEFTGNVPDFKTITGSDMGVLKFKIISQPDKLYYVPIGKDIEWEGVINTVNPPEDGEVKTIKDLFYTLTEYQQYLIASTYQLRRSQWEYSQTAKNLDKKCLSLDNYSARITNTQLYIGQINVKTGSGKNWTSTTDVVKATKEKLYSMDIEPTWSTPLAYIKYTEELGIYAFYVSLYGQETGTIPGLFEVYDSELSLGLNTANINVTSEIYWNPIVMPRNIGALGNSSSAYIAMLSTDSRTTRTNGGTGWDAFLNYLYQVSVGFEIANRLDTSTPYGSSIFDAVPKDEQQEISHGYSVSELDKKLAALDTTDYNAENFSSGDGLAEMVKATIGLYNIMNYLGINKDDWTPTIKDYYELCEKYELWKYAENPYIKNGVAASTSPEEPLGNFFSIESQQMTDSWRSGYALSATYVPFETNLYDATSVTHLDDTDWIADFYYKYGFYRKALYTSTDNQAVVNEYIAGKKSGKRLATLRDLLEYDRDIILYIDDNFYNADEIGDAVSSLDYSAMRSTATEQKMKEEELSEEEEKKSTKITDSLKEGMAELLNIEPDTLLKTGDTSYYSDDIAFKATKLGEDTTFLDGNVIDAYLLDEETLLEAIGESEYSTKQSFAVVSAVYRDAELYNATLRTLVSDNAIFKSSPAVVNIPGATPDQYKHFLNYLMLAGLEDHMKNSATQILDLDAPIFCDLFGNIVTESGYVIIPAAANTTLTNKWTPCTLGFATLVGEQSIEIPEYSTDFREWFTGEYVTTTPDGTVAHLESATYVEHDKMSGWFMEGINGYRLKNSVLTSGSEAMTVDWSCLPKNSDTLKRIAYNKTYLENSTDMYSNKTLNLVMEVLRGAPIENIDYRKEGLDQRKGISSAGVYIAYKMEGFIDSITSTKDNDTGNSMVTMPNLAFVSGIEYIIMYVVKIAFALLILGLFISLYKEGVSGQLGIKSAFKFVGTILMIVVSIAFVPTLISWSYYESNKTLLKDEIGYIAMLNYTKEFDGAEVGITKVTTPESTTELYLKLQDISLDWWDIIDDVLVKNTFDTVTDMYVEQLEGIPIANEDGVIRKGSGLYYPVDRLLDDVVISYNSNRNQLQVKNYNEDGSVASYVTPYFAILQQLVTNVNAYNEANNIRSYSPSVSRTGHIVTYDVCSSYLLSDAFIADGYDILGLGEILDCNTSRPHFAASPFTDTDLELMQYSLWFPNKISDEITRENIKEVEDYARYWISKNKDMFGKIPDEVILKVFALQIATEFNDVFSIPAGQSLEILNIDSKDLTRLMIAERSDVYKYYAYNLARFSLETTGGFGSILTFLFVALQFILQVIKPIFMLLIIGLLLVNVIFRKLLFQKQSRCFEGYIITCACLCACNYAYSALLKLSMNVPDLFGNSIMSIIVAIAIQILYLGVLVIIIAVIKSDWKDMGYNSYAITATGIQGAVQDAIARTTGSFINGMSNILTRHGHGHSSGLAHSVRGGVHRGSNKGFRFKDVTVDSLHENEARHYARGRWDENPDDYED